MDNIERIISSAVEQLTADIMQMPRAEKGWVLARLDALARGADDDAADAYAGRLMTETNGGLDLLTADGMRAARLALGLSQSDLARRLGLHGGARTVAHWEAGTRRITGPVACAMAAIIEHGRRGNVPATE